MKKVLVLFAVTMSLVSIGQLTAVADHTRNPKIVQAITQTAEAVKKDAGIYQRRRVSMEVARIVKDVNKLNRLITPHACLKEQKDQLEKAVSTLRRVQADSDPTKTSAAVSDVASISTKIITITCNQGDAF